MPEIKIKRIYDPAESSDGFRILADRLWPRGLKKEDAKLDLWAKDIAPTTELRKKFHSGQLSRPEFEKLYRAELLINPAFEDFIKIIKSKKRITLLFAAKETVQNHVKVIVDALRSTPW